MDENNFRKNLIFARFMPDIWLKCWLGTAELSTEAFDLTLS